MRYIGGDNLFEIITINNNYFQINIEGDIKTKKKN